MTALLLCVFKLTRARNIVLFLSLVLLQGTIIAQQTALNFINFSSKDGLSSNYVNALLKDRYGYMWFGTDDGLNKFNGNNFKVYKNQSGDSTSIAGNIIMALCEDQSGNLWIGTNQSLSLYNRRKDAFINYDHVVGGPTRALCTDHLGNIWAGSYSGLYMFNPRTGAVKHYESNPVKAGQIKSNTVITVFEDSRKRLWVGTGEGLHLYAREKDSFILYQHSDIDPSSIGGNSIRTITEDKDGRLWVGTNAGVSKLTSNETGFENYSYNKEDANSISCNSVRVIAPDKKGKLWIGTEDGLNIMDVSSGKMVRISEDPRNNYSFKGKSIRSIFIDDNGIFWVGTIHGGVNKYDQNLAFFNLRHSNALDPAGLNSPIVTSFVEAPSGDIYIGTDGGGLNLYRRKTGLFEHPKLGGIENKSLTILAMESVGHEIWIGTYQQGLYVVNTKSGAVKHYTQGNGPGGLQHNEIFCIKKDSKGNVWMGNNGEGVDVFNNQSRTFNKFRKSGAGVNGKLPLNGFIRAIEEDDAGNIWIGSYGSGIAIYNPANNKFRALNRANSNLPSDNILSIYKDKNGTIWLGTFGAGLCMFDERNHKFVSYSESKGLANGVIYKILEDNSGKLWVSTNKGLSSFDPKKKKFKNYSYQNGLQRSPFAFGAGIKTSQGELFFGGLDGFNFFDPALLHCNKNIPSLVFTDLKIAHRSVIPGDDAAIKENISTAREIRLSYKQNFSLDFIALNYTSPQESRYSYKLDGFDNDWNEVGAAHTAVYTNLDPGEYVFRVKARSDDGMWSTPEKTIKVYVKPPFWLTTYAYVFYVMAICFMIALIRYQGIRRIKNKFALEQERIQVRQIIEQERREAERQHEFDQLKIKFLTNLSHEFRTPVSLIVGPVEKILQREADAEKKNELNLVQRNARRLLNLVNQLLDFRKLEENELKLNPTEGDLVSFVKDVADSFKDIFEHKHIHFTFLSSLNRFYTSFDRDKIERILFNILSNAFKFTGNEGKICLNIIKEDDSDLKIIISDTGIGMTPDVMRKIFDRFFQGDVHTSILNQGSGIGLSITKDFVQLHGGTINVQSEPENGSTFTIALPCKEIPKPFDEMDTIPAVVINNELTELQQQNEILPEHEKPTVLIIEDNDDFRNYLKDNLRPYYRIVEAANGKEGWQKALSAHPKIIVSDISMPGIDGITLSRKIRSDKRTSHIPIILLTALTGNTNQIRGLQTGANDYLTKPFDFGILNIKIKNLLALNDDLKNTYSRQIKVVPSGVEVQNQDEKLLLKITRYIETNIDSPNLNVEELSKHVFMSRGSLYSKIVNLTGETPVEFIRSIRLNKAVALLENSNMKIAEVGYAVGFSTPNYFARAFKAKYKTSPSEFISLKKRHILPTGDPNQISTEQSNNPDADWSL